MEVYMGKEGLEVDLTDRGVRLQNAENERSREEARCQQEAEEAFQRKIELHGQCVETCGHSTLP